MEEPTLSGRLGAFLSRLSYDDLSPSQVRRLKIYFLDWLGSAIAGKEGAPVQILLGLIRDLGGHPESTIIASQSYGNCLMAALANGASSHMVEMDDLHRESILHPATQKLQHLPVNDSVEELPQIHLEDPLHLLLEALLAQVVQRLMRRAPRPEPERKGQELLLVNRLQDHRHRPLEDLVLQGRNADRPGLRRRSRLGDVNPSDWWREVLAGLGPIQQRLEIVLQILLVIGRGLAVDPHRPILAGAAVGFVQPFDVHQIRQRREPHLRGLFRQRCYPFLFRCHGSGSAVVFLVFPIHGSILRRIPSLLPGSLGSVRLLSTGTMNALRLPTVHRSRFACRFTLAARLAVCFAPPPATTG